MYAVIWMNVALDALADAFVTTDRSGRESLEASVVRLNAKLAADPVELGESREGRRRIAYEKPCAITFLVDDPSEGVVRVTHFWTY